ncbi:hypothetical protein [Marinobacterium weihaiense]|uniref:Uncharacterized protein n=1 Tax=Marinobacterium weihaiense TaxID=2851016 RepID=A0ABS6MF74_9GAMM|nr:hypothetical protein [Marinobacterium weihaiense]MBV0934489.1 hypothetical protein [Marinobacterium weihaiense]
MKPLFGLMLLAVSTALQAAPMTLGEHLQRLRREVCQAPTAVQMAQVQAALTAFWQKTPGVFRVERLQLSRLPGKDTWLLHEPEQTARGGRGAVVEPVGPSRDLSAGATPVL